MPRSAPLDAGLLRVGRCLGERVCTAAPAREVGLNNPTTIDAPADLAPSP